MLYYRLVKTFKTRFLTLIFNQSCCFINYFTRLYFVGFLLPYALSFPLINVFQPRGSSESRMFTVHFITNFYQLLVHDFEINCLFGRSKRTSVNYLFQHSFLAWKANYLAISHHSFLACLKGQIFGNFSLFFFFFGDGDAVQKMAHEPSIPRLSPVVGDLFVVLNYDKRLSLYCPFLPSHCRARPTLSLGELDSRLR